MERRSVRKFTTQPVDKETVRKIVAAGQRAATARNEQPWLFVAVLDAKNRKAVKDLCPKNGPYIEFAGACVAVFCERENRYWLEDGSAAIQNILNAAHMLGLGSVWIAGDKKDYAEPVRELLKVPATHRLVGLVAIGHPETVPPLTERKPLDEVLRWEHC